MKNTPQGEELLAARRAAENALKKLDPDAYEIVEHWLDQELYGGLFGHGGVSRLSAGHKVEIMNLLIARAAVYRGMKSGQIADDGRGRTYNSEVGNEQMAQAIEVCLEFLGEDSQLPSESGKRWDDFTPEAFR